MPKLAPRRLEGVSVKPMPRTWRCETVTVRGKSQSIYRDIKTGRFIKKPS